MLLSAQVIVVLLGASVAVLSLWGMATPDRLTSMVRGVMEKRWGMAFAIGVRIVLGVSLLVAAPPSAFPLLFKIIGWLTLIAAAALPVIGFGRLRRLFAWFETLPKPAIRLWLIVGVLFGALMLYGILAPTAF